MSAAPDLLVLSDVHLGVAGRGDLDARDAARADRALASFLEAHRAGRPQRLVVAGDLFELMRCAPPSDRPWGEDPGPLCALLDAILDQHPRFVAALRAFLAAGHEVVLLRGNHDPELGAPGVVEHLRARLDAGERLRVEAYAYHEPGVLHVEHGHMVEPYGSWEHETGGFQCPLALGTWLMRDLGNRLGPVNLIEGERWGSLRQARWMLGLIPLRVWLVLPWLFLRTLARLLAAWWRSRSAPAFRPPPPGTPDGSSSQELPGLGRRWVRPGYTSLRCIAGALLLDVFAFVATLVLVPLLAWWGGAGAAALVAALGLLVAFGLGKLCVRYDILTVHARLKALTPAIAEDLGVPLLIFGHTHEPDVDAGPRATFINTGSWLADADDQPEQRAVFNRFTFLRLVRGGAPELLRWCPAHGALPWDAEHPTGACLAGL